MTEQRDNGTFLRIVGFPLHPILFATLYPLDMVARNGILFVPSDAVRSILLFR